MLAIFGSAIIAVTVGLQREPWLGKSALSLLAANNVSSVPSAARQVKRNQTQCTSQTENRPRLLARFNPAILSALYWRK